MLSLEKFRRYELWFILLAITIYVTRRLFYLASAFDSDITIAELSGVPSHTIWEGFDNYSHFYNTIFPIVAAAILFASAWYIFHYHAFPGMKKHNIEEEGLDTQTIILFLLVIILTVASIFVYHYFKLYWRARHDSFGRIIGFTVYSLFRKLHVLSNSFAAIVIIVLYEAISQIYYYTHELYRQKRQPKHQFFSIFILSVSILYILAFTFYATVPNLIIGGNGVIASLIIIFLRIGLHYLFFNIIIPYYAKINFNNLHNALYAFFGICAYLLLGLIVYIFWMTISRNDSGSFFGFYVVPNIFGVISAIIRWYFFVENQQLQTQVTQKSAELNSLRSQINPHFLFNSLNTLYSISLKEKAEKTSDGIQKLGDMMRFMLNENHQDRIPLSKEIEYLQNYIDIQKMRIDEAHDIEIKVNIQTSERDIFIAPMLLNPFVENAFKHGISFRNPSWIYITLTQDAQKLYFKVHNSLHPKTETDLESENNGIGLENVKKRLQLIYPNRHTLDIQASDNDYFVSLVLGIY